MAFACGGKCGRPDCKRTFASVHGLDGHVGGVHARSKDTTQPGAAGISSPGGPGPPSRPFYEGLQTLPWGQEEPKKGATPIPAQTPGAPAGPLFDSSPWWLNLGKLLDETLLADKKVKINMSEAQAKRLDASLQAAGWRVEANPNPVSMPYWLPFAITIVGAFALPLIAGYVPDLIKKAKERAAKFREESTTVHHVEVPAKRAGIQAQAPAVPLDGEEEPEAPPRIEPIAPPFVVRPMPWHSPGE